MVADPTSFRIIARDSNNSVFTLKPGRFWLKEKETVVQFRNSDSITSMAFDYLASNLYYVSTKPKQLIGVVRIADDKRRFLPIHLSTRESSTVTSLAVDSENRIFYWAENSSPSQSTTRVFASDLKMSDQSICQILEIDSKMVKEMQVVNSTNRLALLFDSNELGWTDLVKNISNCNQKQLESMKTLSVENVENFQIYHSALLAFDKKSMLSFAHFDGPQLGEFSNGNFSVASANDDETQQIVRSLVVLQNEWNLTTVNQADSCTWPTSFKVCSETCLADGCACPIGTILTDFSSTKACFSDRKVSQWSKTAGGILLTIDINFNKIIAIRLSDYDNYVNNPSTTALDDSKASQINTHSMAKPQFLSYDQRWNVIYYYDSERKTLFRKPEPDIGVPTPWLLFLHGETSLLSMIPF